MIDSSRYPALGKLLDGQLSIFPEHQSYLERRFADADQAHLELADQISDLITRIAHDHLDEIFEDYKWLTGVFVEEEVYFRRNGTYRLSSFEDAERTVYVDPVYMRKYMNGLLASEVWWHNHTNAIGFYKETFLDCLPGSSRHLEVGPGHGLLLYLATQTERCKSLTAWDVSAASLTNTREALSAMGVERDVKLEQYNIYDAPDGEFDSIVFSEVLEHLEQPLEALHVLRKLLTQDGRLYVHAPVNSPAPDHLYLFRTPEEVVSMVEEAGFDVVETRFYPILGVPLERARAFDLGISTLVVATPSEGA